MNSKSIVFLDLRGRPQLKRVQRDAVHRANPVRRRMPANQNLKGWALLRQYLRIAA